MLTLMLTLWVESVRPEQLQGARLWAAGQIRWAPHIVITVRLSPLGGTAGAFFHWPPTVSIQPSNHGLREVRMTIADKVTLHPRGVVRETYGVCEILRLCDHARNRLHTQDLLCLGTNQEPLTHLRRLGGEVQVWYWLYMWITHTKYHMKVLATPGIHLRRGFTTTLHRLWKSRSGFYLSLVKRTYSIYTAESRLLGLAYTHYDSKDNGQCTIWKFRA